VWSNLNFAGLCTLSTRLRNDWTFPNAVVWMVCIIKREVDQSNFFITASERLE